MKHVVTYVQGETVNATIMTTRQLKETKSEIVEAIEVADDQAEVVLQRIRNSFKEERPVAKASGGAHPSF